MVVDISETKNADSRLYCQWPTAQNVKNEQKIKILPFSGQIKENKEHIPTDFPPEPTYHGIKPILSEFNSKAP